jgi:hypothetical protein
VIRLRIAPRRLDAGHHHLLDSGSRPAIHHERAPGPRRAGAGPVREAEDREARVDACLHGAALLRSALHRDGERPVVDRQRTHRCVVGPRRDRAPGGVPARAVEGGVVENQRSSNATQAEAAQVGGQSPVVLRGERRVSPATHVERPHASLRIGLRIRQHRGDEAVRRPESGEGRHGGEDLQIGGWNQRAIGLARVEDLPALALDHEGRDARTAQGAHRERPIERGPQRLVARRRSGPRRTRACQSEPERDDRDPHPPSWTRTSPPKRQ